MSVINWLKMIGGIMDNTIKIMVCCHKPCKLPKHTIFLPIHVGKEGSRYELGIQSDCEVNGAACDNISALNKCYCEMTAMYWAWKNIRKVYPELEYIGLCHYRRYFKANKINTRIREICFRMKLAVKIILSDETGWWGQQALEPCQTIKNIESKVFDENTKKLEKIIRSATVICTQPVIFYNINVETYFCTIGKMYIRVLREIVEGDYPAYISSFNTVMLGKKLVAANMLIFKIEYLDDYCEFVFGVLEKHRKRMISDGYLKSIDENIYSRILGYLSEILTATYIKYLQKSGVRIKEVGKYFVE
jgi:hypothetical protein